MLGTIEALCSFGERLRIFLAYSWLYFQGLLLKLCTESLILGLRVSSVVLGIEPGSAICKNLNPCTMSVVPVKVLGSEPHTFNMYLILTTAHEVDLCTHIYLLNVHLTGGRVNLYLG